MIGHLSFGVENLERARAFYRPVMATIGWVEVWQSERAAGYGPPGGGDKFALFAHPGAARAPGPGFHVAFNAPDRQAVCDFHLAALAHGGRDDGPPGLRVHYGPTYFATFLFDPDDHKLEAVCQGEA